MRAARSSAYIRPKRLNSSYRSSSCASSDRLVTRSVGMSSRLPYIDSPAPPLPRIDGGTYLPDPDGPDASPDDGTSVSSVSSLSPPSVSLYGQLRASDPLARGRRTGS